MKKRVQKKNFFLCNPFSRNRRAFIELSFAWLFGIIAGAVILVLAIFAATKIINIGQSATGAETQNQIAVLLNPLETSFQTGQVVSLTLPVETRIYNECDSRNGIFGEQIISVSQQNLGRWSTRTGGSSFQNKYIFSDNVVEGKQFFLFSKPFDLPFKMSDIIYMTSSLKEYCFVDSSEDINEELSNLNQENILVVDNLQDCSSESITICFGADTCDINVKENLGKVIKNGNETIFFEDALMFGAIFSEKKVYECQLKRLMERATQLSSLYMQKVDTIAKAGCGSGLATDLSLFSGMTNSFRTSSDLSALIPITVQMNQRNSAAICKLW